MFVKNNDQAPYVPLHVLGLYQSGGALMPLEEGTPDTEKNPMEDIVMMAMQAVEEKNSDLAMEACEMLVEFVQGQAGQTSSKREPAAQEEQPAMGMGGKVDYDYMDYQD